jgi:peptidoglycan/xylan/chitin deacetylase (PgdA/CDA1 family)
VSLPIRSATRRALVDAYSFGLTSGRIDRYRLRRIAKDRGLVVLNLHNVAPGGGRFTRPIPPEVFDDFVGWLKQVCRLTTFAELADPSPADGRPAAILSFDDGYHDFVEYAMPILAAHGVRANQNVVPASVDSGHPPWNVELINALEGLPVDRLRTLELPGGELPKVDPSGGEHALMRWGVEVSHVLKMRSREERDPLVAVLADQLRGEPAAPPQRMMTRRDLDEAARSHEIGVHSYAHDSMEFETEDFFAEDIRSCRDWYLDCFGTEPQIYAFPNGSYTPKEVELLQDSGFEHALLVGERASSVSANVHPRITADGVTLRELRMRLARAC